MSGRGALAPPRRICVQAANRRETCGYVVTAPSDADDTWRAYFPITPDV